MDWERVARSAYISSAINTQRVGEHIARFILDSDLAKVHLIGHSLGAHVAGFAAKIIRNETGVKVQRITALDPAGPYFRDVFLDEEYRLNGEDAQIVDVIHTDAGFYGYEKPIGTLDVYVNGGFRQQPGCTTLHPRKGLLYSLGEILENGCNGFYFDDIVEVIDY